MAETIEARARIFARIRAANASHPRQNAAQAWEKIQRHYNVAPDLPRAEILQLLEDRLLDYDAHVLHCEPEQISSCIERALRHQAKSSIGIPPSTPAGWLPQGFEFIEDRLLAVEELDALDGVLTGATLAIAETGTIVLQDAAGQLRRALTLVPDYHLCVLFAGQVLQTVPQAIRQLQATANLPTTTISGPSATADIEMTRIKGVHGPRHLDVILVAGPR